MVSIFSMQCPPFIGCRKNPRRFTYHRRLSEFISGPKPLLEPIVEKLFLTLYRREFSMISDLGMRNM
jgi:hypothetical protein